MNFGIVINCLTVESITTWSTSEWKSVPELYLLCLRRLDTLFLDIAVGLSSSI